nr:WD repeat-containing protein 74 [Osmia lignaria]
MEVKDNFHIYVGCKSGAFKGIRIEPEKNVTRNIQNLVFIKDNDEVTAMSWGDDEEKEVLIACGTKEIGSIKVYDTDYTTFTCSFTCDAGRGRVNGISRYDEGILTAVESGEVKLYKYNEKEEILVNAGANLRKMRHSKINKKIIATGGFEHYLKLFDLEKQKQVFQAKNVPPDWLQLRVPVWISDMDFIPTTENIVTVGRYGHVSVYDPKTQRRPVIQLQLKDEAITTLSTMPREKQIIIGTGKGKMKLVDLRKPSKVLNTYKGFLGSVTGIACSTSEPYVVSVSLDRYLRIHHIDTKQLLRKVYLTSRISSILLHSGFSLPKENNVNEDSRKNTNGVDEYLKEEHDNVPRDQNSDTDYDILFDKMQVVGDKKHKAMTERKRTNSRNDLTIDNEIIFHKSPLNKNEKLPKSSKKQKTSNLI